ncbi:MAG TPA: hypothetical protein VFX58_17715 [Chitinophagaceae bacterium]|jgi:hypothetical protein|nr:hypothetical protein [Chitinophagaceae bacterium]
MRTVLLFFFTFAAGAVSAQNILDSIEIYDYPVREGVIYKYEKKGICSQTYASTLSIVSVITQEDSVFHSEEGVVAGTFSIDNFHGVTIKNARDEFITYSNLDALCLKKGDKVSKGMCIGTTAPCEDFSRELNQVDILVLQKLKRLPYSKVLQYILSRSTPKRIYYSTL